MTAYWDMVSHASKDLNDVPGITTAMTEAKTKFTDLVANLNRSMMPAPRVKARRRCRSPTGARRFRRP